METIFTVSEITAVLRDAVEKRFPFAWVRGEVTNLSRPASGHIYFTLKDERSQLQCVWFVHKQRASQGNFDPLTGEVYETPRPAVPDFLENGAELLCAGGMSVYPLKGQYQLVVELVQSSGAGLLAQEFERLKLRLAAAGYFNLERKRSLPVNPARIALITSTEGAAIHDFLELAQNRGSGAEIRIYPSLVQGRGAAAEIVASIFRANQENWAQVIVIIRGGGSLEDLWTFNEEALAKAIFESRLPVLAGIGHEVDFTLSDMTADVRAATPSHAAQIIWPLRSELWQRLDGLELELERAISSRLDLSAQRLERLLGALRWLSPEHRLARLEEQFANICARMSRELGRLPEAGERRLEAAQSALKHSGDKFLSDQFRKLELLEQGLAKLDPQIPLRRGYAWLYNKTGPISSVGQVRPGEAINALLADGQLGLVVKSVK